MRGRSLLPLVVAGLLPGLGAASAPGPRAIPFRKVQVSTADAAQICALSQGACVSSDEVAVYRTGEGAWWAILSGRPALLSLTKGDKDWSLARSWDFSSHKGFVTDAGSLTVHPALYPVAPGVWAAAVVETRSESYSGGGGQFSSALFIPLDGKSDAPFAGAVPFSCSRMVRACFSEREYETSRHCHDEWEGWLTLAYAPRGQGAYAWTGTWHESVWRSGVPETQKVTRTTTPHKANFCEWQD